MRFGEIFRNGEGIFATRCARTKLRDACPFLIKLVYLSGCAAMKNTAKVPSNARLSYFGGVFLIL